MASISVNGYLSEVVDDRRQRDDDDTLTNIALRRTDGMRSVLFYLFLVNPKFWGIKTLINVFWLVWVFQRAAGENFGLFSSSLWICLLKFDHFQRNRNPQF